MVLLKECVYSCSGDELLRCFGVGSQVDRELFAEGDFLELVVVNRVAVQQLVVEDHLDHVGEEGLTSLA